MLTLSYGYLKPQNSDTGDAIFPALAADIQQLNDHTHDGLTSAPLTSTSQSISSGSWAAAPIGNGMYRQLVSLPGVFLYDTANMWFKLSTGEWVYPSIEKVSSTSYYIYTNDNSLTYTAFYR